MPTTAQLQNWIHRQWQRRGIWSYLMWPLAKLYGALGKYNRQSYQSGSKPVFEAPVPVIVVGNIYVGGTGKTPVTCALAEQLIALGWSPGLISRGYGRTPSDMPATGIGDQLDWHRFGDEPSLIASKTGIPVSVHADRGLACQHLLINYPKVDLILSDDGLQHYALARSFEILVQDERGIGNSELLPAGPLRESPARLDAVNLVLNRCPTKDDLPNVPNGFTLELTHWRHAVTGERREAQHFGRSDSLKGPIMAVAAIGVPERFFKSIAQCGIALDETCALPDHQPIDLAWLERQPAGTILITEKDATKLQMIEDPRIWIAQTALRWWRDDMAVFLKGKLAQAGVERFG